MSNSIINIMLLKMNCYRKRALLLGVFLILFSYRSLLIYVEQSNKPVHQEPAKPTTRIFCIIPTIASKLDNAVTTIYESWVSYCDNHTFVSLIPDMVPTSDRAEIKYKNLFYVSKPMNFTEESGKKYKLTTKIYAALKDVYSNHKNYDWYLKADDDTFVFVDNLRLFLSDKNSSEPVVYGYDFKTYGGYQSGGAGYALSKESIKRLGERLISDEKSCPNSGTEDLDVGRCLRKLGGYSNKSIDEFGRERFHIGDIFYHFNGKLAQWHMEMAENQPKSVIELI